jgi:hypothetical protein
MKARDTWDNEESDIQNTQTQIAEPDIKKYANRHKKKYAGIDVYVFPSAFMRGRRGTQA